MTAAQVLGMVSLCAAWSFADGITTVPHHLLAAGVAAAGLAMIVRPAGSRARRLSVAYDALAALALHAALLWPLPVMLAHLGDLPGAAAVASLLLEASGITAAPDATGRLLLDTGPGARAIALTWHAAALPMLLRLALCVIVMRPRPERTRAVAAVAAAGGLRLAVMVALLAAGAPVAILYEPAITWMGFLPLAWILPREGPFAPDAPIAARHPRTAAAVLLVGGLLAGAAAGWRPPGERAGGRVLVDESRSDWEWTSVPFDEGLYGQRSLYNYALWKRWLELHFETQVSKGPLTQALLDRADVLIVKTPTSPYRDAEVRLVERFVARGGGLWLIGDHTNLFGMATVLNRLAAPYGIAFAADDTFPLDHEGEDRFTPPWPGSHPALRGIESYAFETSCSLRVPWSAQHIMLGRRLGSEDADYGHVNFFGDIRLQASERFGVFTQAAAVRHGRGRVIAFTDSTNFSNFSMLWPGRRELSLHMVDWLNRRAPRRSLPEGLAFGLAAAALLAAAYRLGMPRGACRALALWGGCAVFAASAAGAAAWSRAAAGEVVPRMPVRTVAFDAEVSDFALAPASPVMSRRPPGWSDFNAFYIDAARSGGWPVETRDLDRALGDHDAVVLVHPAYPPSPQRLDRLRSFLRRGGRLLVVESAGLSQSAAGAWVAPFGLRVSQRLEPVRHAGGPRVPSLEVSASDAAVRVRDVPGGATLAWRDVGAGRVVLLADGTLFSDRARGGVYVPSGTAQAGIHAGQREAMRLLLPAVSATAGGEGTDG